MIHLVFGGARSGKSTLAEKAAAASGLSVRYIATATAGDNEMQDRIVRHQAQRPSHWALTEEPLRLSELIQAHDSTEGLLLVDCLTLWLSNHLLHPDKPDLHHLRQELCETLQQSQGEIILVSNEVGMGIVPMGEISRTFVDHSGWLNQAVAQVANRVTFVAAGLPLQLKGPTDS